MNPYEAPQVTIIDPRKKLASRLRLRIVMVLCVFGGIIAGGLVTASYFARKAVLQQTEAARAAEVAEQQQQRPLQSEL